MLRLKKIIKTLVASLVLLPAMALAAPSDLYPPPNSSLPGGQSAANNTVGWWVGNYINVFLAVVGIIAVAYLIYGGFRYMTSGGNEEAAESAKKIITNSIIGLVVIILSYIIVTVIINAIVNSRTY
jgi:heme/copper-type cytochrome/quinol oxidase subunit 2